MLPIKDGTGGMISVFSTPPWYPTAINQKVYTPDGKVHGRREWTGELPEYGVVFLDEFGQSEDEVKKAAAELLLHGEVGDTSLPMGWRVLAASNRMSDRSGVMRAMMFVVNRRAQLNIDPSLPAWVEWASSRPAESRPHYLTISFARKNPDLVFRDKVPDGSDPFCTPRTLCLMDRDLQALRSDEDIAQDRMPLNDLAREMAAGWIGKGEAAQYYTHLKYADELPDIADIVRDPMAAKLPITRDAQMVCGYMLAHSVTAKNARNVLRYTMRLNIEMQVLTVQAIIKSPLASALAMEPELVTWITKNKKLLIESRS